MFSSWFISIKKHKKLLADAVEKAVSAEKHRLYKQRDEYRKSQLPIGSLVMSFANENMNPVIGTLRGWEHDIIGEIDDVLTGGVLWGSCVIPYSKEMLDTIVLLSPMQRWTMLTATRCSVEQYHFTKSPATEKLLTAEEIIQKCKEAGIY